jgi:predicted LPLAT superfamily acyltransferase
MTADIWLYLFPLYVLVGLLLLLGIFALLGRVAGGRYLRPIVNGLMKVPLLGRGMRKASQAALERQNPELASAVKKLERSGVARDPSRAQQALTRRQSRRRRSRRTVRCAASSSGPARAAAAANRRISSSCKKSQCTIRR